MTGMMILIAAEFDEDIHFGGQVGAVRQFPPAKSGWVGNFDGWQMRVVGDRLHVWSPVGTPPSTAAKAELEANGIAPEEARTLVTIPLHRCVLRYAGATTAAIERGDGDDAGGAHAPSERWRARRNAPPPVKAPPAAPAPVTAKAPQPQPTPRGPTPAPTARRPLGARGPAKESTVVRDLTEKEIEEEMSVRKRRLVPLVASQGSGDIEEE